jgi:hypothetical protein
MSLDLYGLQEVVQDLSNDKEMLLRRGFGMSEDATRIAEITSRQRRAVLTAVEMMGPFLIAQHGDADKAADAAIEHLADMGILIGLLVGIEYGRRGFPA